MTSLDFFYFSQIRSPDPFSFGNNLVIPPFAAMSSSSADGHSNVSSLYPVLPQINYSSLPYERFGNSSFNMSDINASVFVKSNSAYNGPVGLYLSIKNVIGWVLAKPRCSTTQI